MKRFLALSLIAALVGLGFPTMASAGAATGVIAGVAKDTTGMPLSSATVRLRNLVSGSLAGSARTAASGAFTFENLAAGHYVVETIDLSGRVLAASSAVELGAGTALKNLVVTVPSARAQGGTAAAGGGSFFTSTTGIIILSAIAAGTVIAIVSTTGDESPKK